MKYFYVLWRDRSGSPHEMEVIAKDKDSALQVLRVHYPREHYGAGFIKSYSIRSTKIVDARVLRDVEIEDFDLEDVPWVPFE